MGAGVSPLTPNRQKSRTKTMQEKEPLETWAPDNWDPTPKTKEEKLPVKKPAKKKAENLAKTKGKRAAAPVSEKSVESAPSEQVLAPTISATPPPASASASASILEAAPAVTSVPAPASIPAPASTPTATPPVSTAVENTPLEATSQETEGAGETQPTVVPVVAAAPTEKVPAITEVVARIPKQRGRPKGSKNAPKAKTISPTPKATPRAKTKGPEPKKAKAKKTGAPGVKAVVRERAPRKSRTKAMPEEVQSQNQSGESEKRRLEAKARLETILRPLRALMATGVKMKSTAGQHAKELLARYNAKAESPKKEVETVERGLGTQPSPAPTQPSQPSQTGEEKPKARTPQTRTMIGAGLAVILGLAALVAWDMAPNVGRAASKAAAWASRASALAQEIPSRASAAWANQWVKNETREPEERESMVTTEEDLKYLAESPMTGTAAPNENSGGTGTGSATFSLPIPTLVEGVGSGATRLPSKENQFTVIDTKVKEVSKSTVNPKKRYLVVEHPDDPEKELAVETLTSTLVAMTDDGKVKPGSKARITLGARNPKVEEKYRGEREGIAKTREGTLAPEDFYSVEQYMVVPTP
jgi:hypothetical protein